MHDRSNLTETLRDLREELVEAEAHVGRLRRAVAAMEEVVTPMESDGYSAMVAPVIQIAPHRQAPIFANGHSGTRPPLRDAITTVMAEAPDLGWLINDLTNELARRNWVGGQKRPSKQSVRQVLDALKADGLVVAERQGADRWAANLWKLSRH